MRLDLSTPPLSPHSLQSLHFTMMLWAHDGHTPQNRAIFHTLLNLLLATSSSIQTLRLTLHVAELRTAFAVPTTKDLALEYLGALDWAMLDLVLLRCSLLGAVMVEVVNGDDAYVADGWLAKEMREMMGGRMSGQARGVLRFA